MSEGDDRSDSGVVASAAIATRKKGRGTDEDRKWKRMRSDEMVMNFDLLRGSLSSLSTTTTTRAEAAAVTCMDAAVWGRMPEDMTWEVLRFVPATKLCQWQLVSRKWRQVLSTSGHFRKTLDQLSAVAFVSPTSTSQCLRRCCSRSRSNVKAWEVDLSTVVPRSFWREDDDDVDHSSWQVVAAAHGLVCISNMSETQKFSQLMRRNPDMPVEQAFEEATEPGKPWANRYCVVNPVTRTCVVLPVPVPCKVYKWVPPPTSTSVAFLGRSSPDSPVDELVTYHLAAPAAAAAAGGWVATPLAPSGLDADVSYEYGSWAMVGDQTYRYHAQDHKVHVTAPCPGPDGAAGGGQMVVAVLDLPSAAAAALPGVKAKSLIRILDTRTHRGKVLVAHRGAVYFVAQFLERSTRESVLCGVWRLRRAAGADGRTEWEGVTVLDVRKLERLTGLPCLYGVFLDNAYAVREFVCCSAQGEKLDRLGNGSLAGLGLLGFNLDTAKWEVLHDEKIQAMELRRDLF